jgi:plasmid replication initiation protein
VDDKTGQSLGMTLTVADWFHEGILMDRNLLSIDPAYFALTGGRERWLYRIARKHAGGNGSEGFAIPLPTLFEKSGAEGTYRRFKFEMLALAGRCDIPGFEIFVEIGKGAEPALRMVRKGAEQHATPRKALSAPGPARSTTALTDKTMQIARRDFPGWDLYAIKAEFDGWLMGAAQQPDDYQKAFYGFAKQFHARNR